MSGGLLSSRKPLSPHMWGRFPECLDSPRIWVVAQVAVNAQGQARDGTRQAFSCLLIHRHMAYPMKTDGVNKP
jgi:hypothetical protein